MSSFQCLFWLTVGNKYSNRSITSRPLSQHLSHPIQTRKRKEEEEEDLYDFIFGLFVTWVCDEREDDDNLRQLKGKWTTCMEWQSMLVVRGWCSMSVCTFMYVCLYFMFIYLFFLNSNYERQSKLAVSDILINL